MNKYIIINIYYYKYIIYVIIYICSNVPQAQGSGSEDPSLKKITFTHINGIFDENKNTNNIIKLKKIKSST